MPKGIFAACVYYFSLPEFPPGCMIVRDNSLFIRDVLVSNRYNPHVKLGGQYDPHYENSPAPEYRACQKNARTTIMSKITAGSYDRIFLLFRTNKSRLSVSSTQHVAGYYEIDQDRSCLDPEYEEPILYAKEARFTDIGNAPDLLSYLKEYHNRRFFFSSETEDGELDHLLSDWRDKISSAPNLLPTYIMETKRLDGLFKFYEFNNGIYQKCENCQQTQKCPLIKRIDRKGKLYNQLPKGIALKIEKHYRTLGKS